jgi:hypothetical protein
MATWLGASKNELQDGLSASETRRFMTLATNVMGFAYGSIHPTCYVFKADPLGTMPKGSHPY